MKRLQAVIVEGFIRIRALLSCVFWGGVLGMFAGAVWIYGKEHTQALDRPLGQVSLNELISSACGSLLYGLLSALLGCAALAVFWRGVRKLWCDLEECKW